MGVAVRGGDGTRLAGVVETGRLDAAVVVGVGAVLARGLVLPHPVDASTMAVRTTHTAAFMARSIDEVIGEAGDSVATATDARIVSSMPPNSTVSVAGRQRRRRHWNDPNVRGLGCCEPRAATGDHPWR